MKCVVMEVVVVKYSVFLICHTPTVTIEDP